MSTCNRCRVVALDEHYAISRFDNMTRVCPPCGNDERDFERLYGNVPDFRFVLYGGEVAQIRGGA